MSLPGAQTLLGKPTYWDQACTELQQQDRIMRELIPRFGPAHLQGQGDALVTLLRSIVGQQISVKAAAAVWQRLELLLQNLHQDNDTHWACESLQRASHEELRAVGLSSRKIQYAQDLALRYAQGQLDTLRWQTMPDEEIIQELIALRGIGRWTAEMFLMFHLMRPNVLPLDDVGLIKGVCQNYFSGRPVSRSDVRDIAGAWSPWSTVATWYIWRSLDPIPVAY